MVDWYSAEGARRGNDLRREQAEMDGEHRYAIDFPTRPCMKCGETVEHRRERDHKHRHTNFECSNCHHKHTVK